MKYRAIHNYDVMNEDMGIRAGVNLSCQCAEDIVYAKLRELASVGIAILDKEAQQLMRPGIQVELSLQKVTKR